jgi:hypothetical protein
MRLAVWRDRPQALPTSVWSKKPSYFDTHPVTDIVRGLVYTTVLWGLLAVGVYTVYAMMVGPSNPF